MGAIKFLMHQKQLVGLGFCSTIRKMCFVCKISLILWVFVDYDLVFVVHERDTQNEKGYLFCLN